VPPGTTEKRRRQSHSARGVIEAERLRDPKSDKAGRKSLAEIEHEHGIAAHLAHRADGVRRADVARTFFPQILVIENLGDDETPRYRAQKKRDHENGHERNDVLHRKPFHTVLQVDAIISPLRSACAICPRVAANDFQHRNPSSSSHPAQRLAFTSFEADSRSCPSWCCSQLYLCIGGPSCPHQTPSP